MKWVTRERPKIDRVACPWLIARFIDDSPEFLFVPADQVVAEATAKAAIPYDVPGVELTHDGPLCSFDALLKVRTERPALTRPRRDSTRCRHCQIGLSPAVPRLAGRLAWSVSQLSRRPRATRARLRDVRRDVRLAETRSQ